MANSFRIAGTPVPTHWGPWCNLDWAGDPATCRHCIDFYERFPIVGRNDMYAGYFPDAKPLTSKEQQTIDELKAIALEYNVQILLRPGSTEPAEATSG